MKKEFPGGEGHVITTAGTTFVDRDLFLSVTPGHTAYLVPEPDNKYDPNAVMVMCEINGVKEKLGYIPAKLVKEYDFSEFTEGVVDTVHPASSGSSPGMKFTV